MKILIEKTWMVDDGVSFVTSSYVMPYALAPYRDEIFEILERVGVNLTPALWSMHIHAWEDD